LASEFLARTEAKRAPILSFDRLIVNPGAFRLFLAGLVILSHFSAISTGRVGVALFFMLSGYWISSLWNRVGGYGHVLKFFGNRFFRIYPLYIAVVLICILLFPVRITPSTFLLLGVASTEGPRAIGVEWSLDLELEFYILFPILYFIITRYAVYSFAIFWL
jgi:peptidoglycan/LPS O-acetylase OafA/YrhL